MADPRIRYDILANAEGGEDVAALTRELEKLDDAVDPAAANRARELAEQLAALGRQQAALDTFVALKRDSEAAARALDEAQGAAQKLGRELSETEKPTRAQAGQLQKLRDTVRDAKTEVENKARALEAARGKLGEFGVATTDLARTEISLRDKLQDTRTEIGKLGQQGQAVQGFQQLAKATEQARQRFDDADEALEAYRRTLSTTEAPSRAQAQQLQRLSEAARSAQQAFQQQSAAQAQAGTALRAAGVDTERLVGQQRRLPPELTATANAARQVAGGYTAAGAAAKTSADQQTAANAKIDDGLKGIAGRLDNLRNIGIGAILGSQTVQLLRSVTETADAYNNLRARIKLVTGEGTALEAALAGVEAIALRTGASLEATGTLFTRVLTAGRELGLAQEDALKLTESINQAVAISGASAQASDAAITQLIQALQSGVLRGEEFNSVVEQAPRLAQALADGMGVARSELRGLAQDGKISAAAVIEALQTQSAALETEFGQLPATVGRSLENLSTRWSTFIGGLDAATGTTAAVAGGINALAENLDEVAAVAQRAGTVLVAALAVQGAGALKALATQALVTGGAMGVLTTSIEKVPRVINIAIAATGFEIGFQIGDMLRENSELARKLGIGITEFFTALVNDLQFVAEAAKAIFTDDTVGQAFDRYKERAEQQAAIFSDMYRDAEQAPSAVRAAAQQASAELERTGTAAKATGAAVAAGGKAGAAGVASIGKAAETADAAIASLAASAGVKLPALAKTATQQAAAMAELASKSREAAAAVGKALPDAIAKLSGPELEKFRKAFTGALGDGVEQAGLLQDVLLQVGKRAAQALGVDVAKAANTMSKEFAEAEDNLSLLVRSTDALKAAGLDAGNVVGEALRKMADGAKNQVEFDALRVRIEALGKAGTLSKQQVVDLLDTVRLKAEEAAKGVDAMAKAYELFGITSKAELQRVADASTAAWKLIREDATLSLAQKQAAFQKYATDAIAANGGVATSTLKAEAQQLKLNVAVDATGKAFVQGFAAADKAVQQTTKLVDSLGREVNAAGEALNQLAGKIGDVKGIETGKGIDNNRPAESVLNKDEFSITSQYTPPDNSGDWYFDVAAWQAAGGAGGGISDAAAKKYWKRKSLEQARNQNSNTGTRNGFGGPAGTPGFVPAPAPRAPTPSPAPPPPATPGSVVNVTIGGQQLSPIHTASAADAQATLEALEAAYRAGGGS